MATYSNYKTADFTAIDWDNFAPVASSEGYWSVRVVVTVRNPADRIGDACCRDLEKLEARWDARPQVRAWLMGVHKHRHQ